MAFKELFFAELLGSEISEKGIRQYELAKSLGVAAQTVSRWLKPVSVSDIPGWKNLPKISLMTGRPLDELIQAKTRAIENAARNEEKEVLGEALDAQAHFYESLLERREDDWKEEARLLTDQQVEIMNLVKEFNSTAAIRKLLDMVDQEQDWLGKTIDADSPVPHLEVFRQVNMTFSRPTEPVWPDIEKGVGAPLFIARFQIAQLQLKLAELTNDIENYEIWHRTVGGFLGALNEDWKKGFAGEDENPWQRLMMEHLQKGFEQGLRNRLWEEFKNFMDLIETSSDQSAIREAATAMNSTMKPLSEMWGSEIENQSKDEMETGEKLLNKMRQEWSRLDARWKAEREKASDPYSFGGARFEAMVRKGATKEDFETWLNDYTRKKRSGKADLKKKTSG